MGNNSQKAANAEAAANKPHPEDYYEVLGVRMDADKDKISSAYVKESEKWFYEGVDEAHKAYFEKRFRLVSEAYQVLRDERTRAQYGQYGKSGLTVQFQDPRLLWRQETGIERFAKNTVPLPPSSNSATPASGSPSTRGSSQGGYSTGGGATPVTAEERRARAAAAAAQRSGMVGGAPPTVSQYVSGEAAPQTVSEYVSGVRDALLRDTDVNTPAIVDAEMDNMMVQAGGKGYGRGRRGGHRGRGGMSEEAQLQAAIQASNMHAMQGGMDEETALAAALQASASQQ